MKKKYWNFLTKKSPWLDFLNINVNNKLLYKMSILYANIKWILNKLTKNYIMFENWFEKCFFFLSSKWLLLIIFHIYFTEEHINRMWICHERKDFRKCGIYVRFHSLPGFAISLSSTFFHLNQQTLPGVF